MTEKKQIPGLPYASDITDLAKNYKFSSSELLLLHTLRSGMNSKNKKNWRAQETLALEMGCTRPTVIKAVAGLRRKNIITCETRKNLNFIYQIIFPFKPKGVKKINIPCKDSLQESDKILNKRCKDSLHLPVKILATNEVKEVVKRNNKKKSSSSIHLKSEEEDFFKTPSSKKDPAEKRKLETFPEKISLLELKEKFGFNYNAFNLKERESCEKIMNLGHFTSFFKDQKIFSVSPCWDEQMNIFIKDVLHIHWSQDSYQRPGVGIRNNLIKFCLCGAAYHFGFDPKTQEEIVAEEIRFAKEEIESEERARVAAIEQEELKQQHEKELEAKLKVRKMVEDFIYEPSVRAYLENYAYDDFSRDKFGCFNNCNAALAWIKRFKKNNGLKSGADIIEFCKKQLTLN